MPKYDFAFKSPMMNAAGMLGFAPEARQPVDWAQMGAFITNPVSLEVRTPANKRCCLPFPGGFLLHTGYPNPGLRAVLRRHASRWARASLPVIVHLLAQRHEELVTMTRMLEAVEGVAGYELGLPLEVDQQSALEWASAAEGELPWIARLPLERALELGPMLVQAGAAAISLGAPRGALPNASGRLVEGRLYGPAVFPAALYTVDHLARQGVPVIGAGGIYTTGQVKEVLEAGAMGVQLDAVLWGGGFWLPENQAEPTSNPR
jgi:dihydroorotate dehydrogenase (NAD+) catalytic subunit